MYQTKRVNQTIVTTCIYNVLLHFAIFVFRIMGLWRNQCTFTIWKMKLRIDYKQITCTFYIFCVKFIQPYGDLTYEWCVCILCQKRFSYVNVYMKRYAILRYYGTAKLVILYNFCHKQVKETTTR